MGSKQLISERERQLAIHELEGCFERGFIDEAELDRRREMVRDARTADQIEPWLADLRARRRGRRELRVTDHEREAAMRRLEIHLVDGQLAEGEYERRKTLVKTASTAAEISEALTELPALRPGREHRDEQFVSDAEREEALVNLDRAREEGRIDRDQYLARVESVRSARTRSEIQSFFRGIPQARFPEAHIEKHRKTAEDVGRAAVGTGARLAFGFLVIGWLGVCSIIVVAWLATGVEPTIPIVSIVLVTLMSLVLLWLPGFLAKGVRR